MTLTDEERKTRWAAVFAKVSLQEATQLTQEMVQKSGPLPDYLAEAFRERIAQG